ncbi:MAG TPA: alkaline phosphatase family protein [Candidatus Angelobacter sp.]
MSKAVPTLIRKTVALLAALALILGTATAKDGGAGNSNTPTATPIKHLVVIFQVSASFDHYFGTYPEAANPAGEPQFQARPGTPGANRLNIALLLNNPNLNPANGSGAANPFRIDRAQALASWKSGYGQEQAAINQGLMDLFPREAGDTTGASMGFYDGNTVTALWNYAQHFVLSDNLFSTGFGSSTPGAINLVSGQTNGVTKILNGPGSANLTDGGAGTLTVIGNASPLGDICSSPDGLQVQLGGSNIGDLLNAAGVSWGWFQGGFDLTRSNRNGTTGCNRSTQGRFSGVTTRDYFPEHAPFMFFASTSNPAHIRPASVTEIGHNGPANHQYDINDFFTAAKEGGLPAVSFLKPIAAQDGAGPLDEQDFVVTVINFLQEQQKDWPTTAVVIMFGSSGGWYDHAVPPLVNPSTSPADALTGFGACGDGSRALPGAAIDHAQGRCGFGPRTPLLLVSPLARENFVDHTLTNQASVLRFIEDNWLGGQRIGQGSFDAASNSLVQMFDFSLVNASDTRYLYLDPVTGQIK